MCWIYFENIKVISKFLPFLSYFSGITPKVTNEVGIYVDTSVGQAKKMPRAAMLNAEGTRLHRLKTSKDKANARALIAFPNDRAQSIRPSDPRETFKWVTAHFAFMA